jgi:LuxR family maltose regulon positive regulatory protein
MMARVETTLLPQVNETVRFSVTGPISPPEARASRAAEEALLHRRLHLLRTLMVLGEIIATRRCGKLDMLHEEMQELDRDEEAIWHMVPLFCSFILHYKIRREGALLMPQLLEVRRRGSQSASHFATLKVMQWLAQVALEAGQLHLAYEESQAALDLIEQIAGYVLLKGYFEIVQAEALYQWNRLEEARGRLQTALHDAAIWQQLDVLGWGYAELMQVELARGDRSMAEFALHEAEQLILREGFGIYPSWLPTLRAQWWLAQGKLAEASDWAEGVVFQEETWEVGSYEAFPVVIRVHFAGHSFPVAVAMLERWSTHLDRPANMAITITYLSQSLVALHQVGKSEQARVVAVRLFALTEPEGYLRVYLDEGEPMRQALQALFPPHSKPQELTPSTTAYVAKLLAAFEQQKQDASPPVVAATTGEPALASAPQASIRSWAPGVSLTRREREVLGLLATGASDYCDGDRVRGSRLVQPGARL